MRIRGFASLAVVGGMAATMSGCTTFSFAPPPVETDKIITEQTPSTCRRLAPEGARMIDRNVEGALELTNNFLRAYRCAAQEAADGRQIFQIPSFFAAIAAAVGPTFGLADDGRIAAAASAAVLDRGNSYYAPKDKARVLDSALDSILCVKTEAVGISFFDTTLAAPDSAAAAVAAASQRAAESAENASASLDNQLRGLQGRSDALYGQLQAPELMAETGRSTRDVLSEEKRGVDAAITDLSNRKSELDGQAAELRRESTRLALLAASQVRPNFTVSRQVPSGTIEIDVQRQYFEMVAASLFSVERVLAQRLSDAGTYDPAGIAAEFKQLTGEQQAADKDVDDATDAPLAGTPAAATAKRVFASEAERNGKLAELSLDSLQPRLQQCVVRAKI
jgi:hypothetical protein